MQYHIILTERCNLKCKYCYEKSMHEFDNGLGDKWNYDQTTPFDSEVSVEKIKKLLKPEDRLIFYGGEPLIMVDKIKEIIGNVQCKFGIQTNGVFLKRLSPEHFQKIDKILISIDGNKLLTNKNRGAGIYETVLRNIKWLREQRYNREIVARMTVSQPDIYDQVRHLIDLINEGLFDSIHWQIDAGFYKFDFNQDKFSKFIEEYNKNITKLIGWWFERIKEGEVYKIYPFIGIFNRLVGWDTETRLPCGSGYGNFTINTSGKLSACPIMNSVENFYCGDIEQGIIKKSKINDPTCSACPEKDICGGRCLYWREAKLWPAIGDELICNSIKHIIKEIREKVPEVQKLIDKGIIKKENFLYEKYFGPEIIP